MKILKQFLKPDWRKIVAFFILVILGLTNNFFYWGRNCDLISPGTVNYMIPFLPVILPECISKDLAQMYNLILYPIGLIIIYLISCLIFWIYDKVKKK